MLLYDSLNLIISGVHQSHLGCWGHRSEKVKLRGFDNVTCKMCQCDVLPKDTIIIRNVFGSYYHFVKMVEHLNNAIHWHAIHACWKKLQFLPWRPSSLAPSPIWWLLSACETGSGMPFPFLGLVWYTHPIVLW